MDTIEWHQFCEKILTTFSSNEEIDIVRKNFLMLNHKFGITFTKRALNDDYAVIPNNREIQGRVPLTKEALVIYLWYAANIIYRNPSFHQTVEIVRCIGYELEWISLVQWEIAVTKIVAQLNKSAGFN